ncbi:hypothetical protein C8J57DRAFT_1221997 [Mycena rebaudengoi]|nr:hypothetical protein C8J57DRAFT_1221997 [Mycena rebaudengoi]
MADAIKPIERKRRRQQRLAHALDALRRRGDELHDAHKHAAEGARRNEVCQREAAQHYTPRKIIPISSEQLGEGEGRTGIERATRRAVRDGDTSSELRLVDGKARARRAQRALLVQDLGRRGRADEGAACCEHLWWESVTKRDEGGPKVAQAHLLLTTSVSSSKYTDLLELDVFAWGNRRWHMYLD